MWKAGRAGNSKAVQYGYNPEAPSGHFQRHLNGAMKDLTAKRNWLYTLRMQGSSRSATGRVVHDLMVFVPHERLDEWIRNQPGSLMRLADAREEGQLPEAYFEHPLVREAPPDVMHFALSLFVDGVAYSLTDTVIGFWFVDMLSERRFLFAVIRKRLVCD